VQSWPVEQSAGNCGFVASLPVASTAVNESHVAGGKSMQVPFIQAAFVGGGSGHGGLGGAQLLDSNSAQTPRFTKSMAAPTLTIPVVDTTAVRQPLVQFVELN
jgi:hypothetical protein